MRLTPRLVTASGGRQKAWQWVHEEMAWTWPLLKFLFGSSSFLVWWAALVHWLPTMCSSCKQLWRTLRHVPCPLALAPCPVPLAPCPSEAFWPVQHNLATSCLQHPCQALGHRQACKHLKSLCNGVGCAVAGLRISNIAWLCVTWHNHDNPWLLYLCVTLIRCTHCCIYKSQACGCCQAIRVILLLGQAV